MRNVRDVLAGGQSSTGRAGLPGAASEEDACEKLTRLPGPAADAERVKCSAPIAIVSLYRTLAK